MRGLGTIFVLLVVCACQPEETSIKTCDSRGQCDEYLPDPSNPGGSPRLANRYPSARGTYTLESQGTIYFPAFHTFEAVTSKAGRIFFHLKYAHATNINYNRIYEWTLQAQELVLLCSWIEDTPRRNGLAIDETYYYFRTSESSARFRRHRRDTCAEESLIAVGLTSSTSYGYHLQIARGPSAGSSELVWLHGDRWAFLDLATATARATIQSLQYGTASVSFNSMNGLLVDQEVGDIWLGSSARIWRFDSSWGTPNYADLPGSSYFDLYYVAGLARSSPNRILLFTEGYQFYDRVKFFLLDVTHF